MELLRRVIALGVHPGLEPAQVRRVQTINLASLSAIVLNLLYAGFFVAVDAAALAAPIAVNASAALVNILVFWLNANRRLDGAMALSFATALVTLTLVGYLLGVDTGVYLYLLAIPQISVLVTPPGSWKLTVGGAGLGLVPFIFIALTAPATPEPIAGSPLESVLLTVSVVGAAGLITGISMYYRRVAEVAEEQLQEAHRHSERLLHNILPVEIAERLKGGEGVIADRVEDVSVLFADLVGSTPLAEKLSSGEMVTYLNDIFCPFDDLADALGLEKIKTIGDAYMVVGGLQPGSGQHLRAIAEMALAMKEELPRHPVDGFGALQMRFGVHVGPVVAGVIGKRKFSYDLWGDTVNTAARMESHGEPDAIHVTDAVYQRLRDAYQFEERGLVDIKGKGPVHTYFLVGRR